MNIIIHHLVHHGNKLYKKNLELINIDKKLYRHINQKLITSLNIHIKKNIMIELSSIIEDMIIVNEILLSLIPLQFEFPQNIFKDRNDIIIFLTDFIVTGNRHVNIIRNNLLNDTIIGYSVQLY